MYSLIVVVWQKLKLSRARGNHKVPKFFLIGLTVKPWISLLGVSSVGVVKRSVVRFWWWPIPCVGLYQQLDVLMTCSKRSLRSRDAAGAQQQWGGLKPRPCPQCGAAASRMGTCTSLLVLLPVWPVEFLVFHEISVLNCTAHAGHAGALQDLEFHFAGSSMGKLQCFVPQIWCWVCVF